MPTVHYILPAQGWRPYTNPRPLSGLRGRLGGLGADNTFSGCVQAYDANGNSVACSDASAVIWIDAQGNTVPAPTAAAAAATLAPSAPSATAASSGIPTGGFLNYTGTWTTTLLTSAQTILQEVLSTLQGQGFKVVNSQIAAGAFASTTLYRVTEPGAGHESFSVSLQLQVTGPGFAQASDAGAIVDHAVYTVTGMLPTASNTVYAGGGSGAGGAAGVTPPPLASATAPIDLTTWLENNALWIGLGIAAVVLLPKLI